MYDEKTPGLFKTEWDGDGMVALNSETYYCRDSQGQDKLSSKGLQKEANADSFMRPTTVSCLQNSRADTRCRWEGIRTVQHD